MPDSVRVDPPRVRCYFCTRDLTHDVQVTLGEYDPAFQCVVCENCAQQPYPLAEIARVTYG
jgi:hypothetical protein